ncbi:MAG: MBL fold metallo-hydrolase [Leptolyngbya sp. PLA1]|nr:MBL fold metallo-hydrolase [Leptolyngbya sp. PLA1]
MRTPTRRDFLVSSAAFLASGSLLAHARSRTPHALDATFFDWQEVAPGVLVALNRTGGDMNLVGGNSLLWLGTGGALLVDTKQAVLGSSLLREARTKSAQIAACVNTHHHFDHAGGNHAVTAASIPLTAHARACERLADPGQAMLAQLDSKIKAIAESTLPGAAAVAADASAFRETLAGVKGHSWKPTQCVTGDSAISVGDRTAELRWFGGGHTDNDLAVHCTSVNVLATGDLVFHGMHAYYDASAAANTARWQASLRELVKLCDAKTVVVPGHGPVSDASCIRAQIEYFDRMREHVAAAVAHGRTRDEVVKLDPPEAYKSFGLRQALGYLLGGLFDELAPVKPGPQPTAPKPAGA